MARAKLYGFVGGTTTDPAELAAHIGDDPAGAPASGCTAAAAALPAGNRKVIVDPGANRAGVDLVPELLAFVRRMAQFLPTPPIITTGTNHSQFTTTGNVSDHWDGHAADLGSLCNGFPASSGGYGDKIAEAAFLAAGETQSRPARRPLAVAPTRSSAPGCASRSSGRAASAATTTATFTSACDL